MDINIIKDTPARWPVSSSEVVYADRWPIALRADTLESRAHSGDPWRLRRLVLEHPGSVVVLALSDRDDVLCLKQYRHAVGFDCLELPGGLIDGPGEEPLKAARRELKEEAGLEASTWELLSTTYPSAGLSNECVNIYLARKLTSVGRENTAASIEEEVMTSMWVPLSQLVRATLDGRVRNAQLAV